ncbi:MAG: DUF7524 family protein [Halanaeroarchaeum sp.]
MTASLRVHVNRDEPRSVEPEADVLEVDDPFDIVLENHGQPAHVHVSVDDALAAISDVEEANWYLTEGEIRTIPVDVHSIDAVEGRLEVATGYGAERGVVDVRVAAGTGGVDVDESLGEIQADTEPAPTTPRDYVAPTAFVALGIVVSILVAVLVEDVVAVAAGIATVVVAVGIALFLLFSG